LLTISSAAPVWHATDDRRAYRAGRVADALRDAIGTGELSPGERLIEKELAERFGTSRAPVREAIRELAHEGLVQLTAYRSAVVLGVSDDEVHDVLIPIRLTLERFAFPRALAHLGEEQLHELAGILAGMEAAAAAGSVVDVVDADVRFHESVLALSGAPHTVQVWRTIAPRIRTYFLRYDRERDLNAVVQEHRELYDLLAAGAPQPLIALLESHIAVPRAS
jgi:DNA-binding GntR family transcriptional regulator